MSERTLVKIEDKEGSDVPESKRSQQSTRRLVNLSETFTLRKLSFRRLLELIIN